MSDLSRFGPWAVIAGGSEGTGAAFADQLAAAGINLLLIARKPGPLEETAEAARRHGVEVRTLAVDLTDASSIARITETTADVEIGLLVYNAGANTAGGPFLSATVADAQGVIDLNITAMLGLVQAYAPAMKERRRGGILLVGSLAGYVGTSTESVYGGAKAFSRIFAEGLWSELREDDVRVLELVLGLTRTPAMERAGLNFDIPGLHVGVPAEVVREGLAALAEGSGPVHVASGNETVVEMRTTTDRARLVRGTEKVMKLLVPGH